MGLDQPGHLLAIGDGAWESVDGGVRWQSISIGLSGPEQWDAARSDEVIWIAGDGGVARLTRPEVGTSMVQPVEQDLPPVGALVELALSRQGLNLDPLLIQRSIHRAILAPHLSITGTWERDQSIDADFGALTNSRSDDVGWKVVIRLCYGQCGGNLYGTSTDPFDYGEADLLTDVGDLDVAVVGDQVYVIDGAGAYSAIAANVSDRVSRYRRSVADAVTDLYFSHLMLSLEMGGVQSRSIREQVALDLEIQEVRARLDAYTDGYFSRALAAR
jgi:hypothetical protein